MFTRKYWYDVLERTVATMAQTLLAVLGTDAFTAVSLDAGQVALVVGFAGVLTVVKALAATKVGAPNTAAWLPAGPDTQHG
jgi:hypothetical protein